jgi:Putative Ig domain
VLNLDKYYFRTRRMAIFTASQATQSVTSLATSQADQAYQLLIDRYQGIFDLVAAQSALGNTSISWNMTLAMYNEIKPVLAANGYTVSSWTIGSDVTKSSGVTISWPRVSATVYPSIAAITPTQIQANQNVYFTAQFSAQGGTAPYTYTITGTVPTGLTWSTLIRVTTITLSGTPTQPAIEAPGFSILATDANGQTFSQDIAWTVNATNIINVTTLSAGTNALSFNANTGTLSFTPYLLPTATTSTLGAVIVPAQATSGIVNTSGTIGLATASTTQLGAIKVDGTSIQVVNGVASLNSTTTLLDQRIRAIAIASSVAFGV